MDEKSELRIAAHIGVKDEIELIGRCISHLRKIGVSQFIVCDTQSADGTAEFLDSQRSDSFHILKLSNTDPADVWLHRNSQAARQCQADWLVFLDADEFVLAASGSLLTELAAATADLVSVPRFNVPLGPWGRSCPSLSDATTTDEIELIIEMPPDFRRQLEADPSLPWIRAVPIRR